MSKGPYVYRIVGGQATDIYRKAGRAHIFVLSCEDEAETIEFCRLLNEAWEVGTQAQDSHARRFWIEHENAMLMLEVRFGTGVTDSDAEPPSPMERAKRIIRAARNGER